LSTSPPERFAIFTPTHKANKKNIAANKHTAHTQDEQIMVNQRTAVLMAIVALMTIALLTYMYRSEMVNAQRLAKDLATIQPYASGSCTAVPTIPVVSDDAVAAVLQQQQRQPCRIVPPVTIEEVSEEVSVDDVDDTDEDDESTDEEEEDVIEEVSVGEDDVVGEDDPPPLPTAVVVVPTPPQRSSSRRAATIK
jgi:hypothetical protein